MTTGAAAQQPIFNNTCTKCWVLFRKQRLVEGVCTACRIEKNRKRGRRAVQ